MRREDSTGRGARAAPALKAIALAAAVLLAAVTRVSIAGHWQGLFLLRGKDGPWLELKDDLFLGDGSRLLTSVSFSRVRQLARTGAARPGEAWLDLEWDEAGGSGILRNHLRDGTELVTLFGRYEDSEGGTPRGLFVGGAVPDVAADRKLQNESGITFHDARGWSHVWCNVNEGIADGRGTYSFPSAWAYLGSRVVIQDRERVVIESSHELEVAGVPLRMDRYAYFRAGSPWLKLGIRLVNVGDAAVRYWYLYGDEPWVGEFGSANGNVGWVASGLVLTETTVDAVANRWAGIIDRDSGIANFIAWTGGNLPDIVYFSNHPGGQGASPGAPLTSNEVFIGLQWSDRLIRPGESQGLELTLGLAELDAAGEPRIRSAALPAELVTRAAETAGTSGR